MKIVISLIFVTSLCFTAIGQTPSKSQIVTDGFISQFVPRSPDAPESDCRRLFNVYLPGAFFDNPDQSFPIVYHMTGLGGNFSTYSQSDQLAMDMMLAAGQIEPIVIVTPDPRVLNYDGSFYVDSILNGQFEKYIVEELIPFVDKKYRQKTTADGRSQPFRAMMGQSMGGYASLYYGIKHPELFVAYAGDSATSFWLITTNLASPDGNPMYTFNKLRIPELPEDDKISPDNGDLTFGFYSWAGAFSPVSTGPAECSTEPPACKEAFPFCVAYPFLVNPNGVPVFVTTPLGRSFVPNNAIINRWHLFDPFFILNDVNLELIRRQAIYLDVGSNLTDEIIDNVGARFFSDKLINLNINHEYLLFFGGHTTCTTINDIQCYRFTTNLKIFSGKFAEAGVFAPDVRTRIVGNMTIELADSAVMSINNKALVGVETAPTQGINETDITFRILDSARLEIGNATTLGGGLQVGNQFGKAILLGNPSFLSNIIRCTFEINGPQATLQIGRQGYLGFGIGIEGNQTAVPNFWGLSSLSNVDTVRFNLQQGFLTHNQIASSMDPKAALMGIGESRVYTFQFDPQNFVIEGGANIAEFKVCNLIHPTVLTTAGSINPGGIRNMIDANPATIFDDFYGPPKGLYASHVFYRNLMTVSIMASTTMLTDNRKASIPVEATQDQLFNFLKMEDYLAQGTKRAAINDVEGALTAGYITQTNSSGTVSETINRPVIAPVSACSPLSTNFNVNKIVKAGEVGIKLATVNGQQMILRLYDLNPTPAIVPRK